MNDLKNKYLNKGTSYIKQDLSPFYNKEIKELETACEQVKKEFIRIGDAGEYNHLWVGRFLSDKDRPRILNKNIAIRVLEILSSEKVKKFVKNIINFDDELYLRRVQYNKIEPECYIGYHLDIDSNPDYLCACVIQLGKEYSGGKYRVYQKDKTFIDYKSEYRSLIISDCNYPHEVTKVTEGSRQSLVFFFSNHNKKNKRRTNGL